MPTLLTVGRMPTLLTVGRMPTPASTMSRRKGQTTGRPMMSDPRDVILRPVVSEKSYALLDQGVYTFLVAPDATKIEIRQAVERIFGVTVLKVNTLNRPGKRKRNRKQQTFGKRSDTKRAVVTLAAGQNIPIFEGN
jgi:large subunit ribosomal protein L23